MQYDEQKIEDTVLALLGLFAFEGNRSWKGYDFTVMDKLYEHGYIQNPMNKNKSVYLTDKGMEKAEKLIKEMFEMADGENR